MPEVVKVIHIDPDNTVVTGAETTVYTFEVDGGTLQDINTLLQLVQAKVSLSNIAAKVIVRLKYGSALVAQASFGASTNIIANAGLVIEGVLSGDGSPNLQVMHLAASLGTELSNIAGVMLGVGSGSEASSGDLDLVLTIEITDGGGSGVSVIPSPDNIGNGTFDAPPTLSGSAEDGDYVLICTAASPGSGTFSVTSPSAASLDDLTVGVLYSSLHFNGTLNAGVIDFEVGDEIIIRVVVSGSSVTIQHAVLKLISFVEEAEAGEGSGVPDTYIMSISKLSKIPHYLFKDVRFYGEFLHHLDIMGIGSAVVARASAQNATWNDGAAHSVSANNPRFEYSAGVPLGLLINSAVSETLTIAGNNLHDSNTLFWFENSVLKVSPGDTNPFNSSGVWTGTNNIHISHVLKFSRALTATEIVIISGILNAP